MHSVQRLCLVCSRRKIFRWRKLFASLTSLAIWSWTATLIRFRLQNHIRFYRSTAGSMGMTWTRSRVFRVFHNWLMTTIVMQWTRSRTLQETTMFSKLLPHWSMPWGDWTRKVASMYGECLLVFILCKHFPCICSTNYQQIIRSLSLWSGEKHPRKSLNTSLTFVTGHD